MYAYDVMSLQQWPVCAAALQGGGTTATGGGLTAKVRLQCAWCWCWCLDQVIHPNTVQHCRHGDTPPTLQSCRDGEMERGVMAGDMES